MTAPVMMSHASSGTEMQFFLPEKFQQNPPSPINDEVTVSDETNFYIIVWEKIGLTSTI